MVQLLSLKSKQSILVYMHISIISLERLLAVISPTYSSKHNHSTIMILVCYPVIISLFFVCHIHCYSTILQYASCVMFSVLSYILNDQLIGILFLIFISFPTVVCDEVYFQTLLETRMFTLVYAVYLCRE